MQAAVDHFFQHTVQDLVSQLAELEQKVEPLSLPENEEHLHALERIMSQGLQSCRALDETLGGDPELVKAAQARFREATALWCNQSWIINRARTKPRGFPGDYQMLLAIYEGFPIARGFGGYLDRVCLKMTLGKAVNARLQDAKAFLQRELQHREGPVQILDIASGPGREFQGNFGIKLNYPIQVTCVDSDSGALEYVRRHVAPKSSPNFRFNLLQHNALKMRSGEAIVKQFGRQDIIYSVGLADYIPDKLLIPMLAGWKDALNPEGSVYVSFKDMNRYDKVEYQWLMDWHFLQRDENDCLRLLEQAGYDMETVQSQRDKTGVILNYLAPAQASSFLRVDPGTERAPRLAPAQHSSANNLPVGPK